MGMTKDLNSTTMSEKDSPIIADKVNKVMDGVNTVNEKQDRTHDKLEEIKSAIEKTGVSKMTSRKSMLTGDRANTLINIYQTAIQENNIIPFLNADPESEDFYSLYQDNVVNSFVEAIKQRIITVYTGIQDGNPYIQIKRFAELLREYSVFIHERVSTSKDNRHFVLSHEEVEVTSIQQAASRTLTGREEVRGLFPQKPSMFDGKGVLKVRSLDRLHYDITGEHFLYGTAWGGWVDRDRADEASDELINSLFDYTSQKETVSEQMLDVFRFTIDKCEIVRYIKCDPTYRLEFPVVQIDYFMSAMDEMFDKYRHHQKESTFENIYNFTCVLREYAHYLACNLWPLGNGSVNIYAPDPQAKLWLKKGEKSFEDKVLEYRNKINELYGYVCVGETMAV